MPSIARVAAGALFLVLAACASALEIEPSAGQEENPLARYLDRRAYSCGDVSLNVMNHIPRLVAEDKPDSVRFLLGAWFDACPAYEPLARTGLLFNIWQDEFSERDYEEEWIRLVQDFDPDLADIGPLPNWWGDPWQRMGLMEHDIAEYERFLRDFARVLAEEERPGTTEYLFTAFYGGLIDDFFAELRAPAYGGTHLRRAYVRELRSLQEPEYAYFGVASGAWIPTANLEKAGTKFNLTALGGYRRGWLQTRLVFSAAVNDYDGEIVIRDDGELLLAGDLVPVSVGIEFGATLVDRRAVRLDLLGGGGYTGAQWNDTDYGQYDAKYLHSWDLGLGAGIYRPLGVLKNHALGLEVWRRWMDFDAGDGGSDLSGGVWIVNLVYCWAGDDGRAQRLRQLGSDRWDTP